MKKLRYLLFEQCNRRCEGCCNNDWDLSKLESTIDFRGYDEILLTGGEPMLRPDMVINIACAIGVQNPSAKIYMYTAKTDDIEELDRVMYYVDGITVTLHTQEDVDPFVRLNAWVESMIMQQQLRLNVFKGVDTGDLELGQWIVKRDMVWIENCPLPENEEFKRWPGKFPKRKSKANGLTLEDH